MKYWREKNGIPATSLGGRSFVCFVLIWFDFFIIIIIIIIYNSPILTCLFNRRFGRTFLFLGIKGFMGERVGQGSNKQYNIGVWVYAVSYIISLENENSLHVQSHVWLLPYRIVIYVYNIVVFDWDMQPSTPQHTLIIILKVWSLARILDCMHRLMYMSLYGWYSGWCESPQQTEGFQQELIWYDNQFL